MTQGLILFLAVFLRVYGSTFGDHMLWINGHFHEAIITDEITWDTPKIKVNGDWQWLAWKPWDYINGHHSEPSNRTGKEHYLHYYWDYQGTSWNEAAMDGWLMICGLPVAFVVEYDFNPIPVPGAIIFVTIGLVFASWRLRRCRNLNLSCIVS